MTNGSGPDVKTCTKCSRDLVPSPEYYYHNPGTADGYTSDCKECRGGSFGIKKPNHMGLADEGMLICVKCMNQYPESSEYFHRRGDGFKTTCKECRGGSFGIHDKNKVVSTPEGYKICVGCDETLPADVVHFHRTKKTSDGFQSQCKECHGLSYGIQRPNHVGIADEGYWYCVGCDEQYPVTEEHFYYKGGSGERFESYCKKCSAMRRNDNRQARLNAVENDLTTKEWKSIKEKWGCDDGFRCAYCATIVKEPERDHVEPLCDGGPTSHHNIVPACPTCNRSKGPRPVVEWYPNSGHYDEVRWTLIKEHAGL